VEDNVFTLFNLGLLFVTLVAVAWAGYVHRRAMKLTRQDGVTGALNRSGFIEVLADESKRARRYLHPLTVVYVDLDDFKLVNDLLGHRTGNTLLQAVARTMQNTLREVDFVARLGGDEFALLLSETKAEDVHGVLNKLQAALFEAMEAKNWRVTFSIGAVTFNDPRDTAEDMIAKADELMYSVKLSGKNRIEHSVLDKPNKTDHLVRCSDCRTSFADSSHVCPICGGTALLDLHSEHQAPTQRGVQAYITNLERELTGTVRSLEAILDILVEANTSETRRDGTLRLCKEDMQKIAAAVGTPEAFAESKGAEGAHAPLLVFKQRVSDLRAVAANRRRTVR
jgi:diguanylate cyclase (GGDEF)-like protein